MLPSPALVPKGNSVNITQWLCRVWLPPDALCQLWNGTCFQGHSCPVIMFGRMADTIPGALRSVSHTNKDCWGPCGCWTGSLAVG